MSSLNHTEHVILKDRLPLFIERLNKINERLLASGAPTINASYGETQIKHIPTERVSEYLPVVNVQLSRSIEAPAGSFELVAASKIDPVTEFMEHKTYSSLSALEEDKVKNPVSACFCDHCERNQKRIHVYSLRTSAGIVRVGSGCLDNFTGFSNLKMSKWINALNSTTELLEEMSQITFTDAHEHAAMPVDLFICQAIGLIDKDGYRSGYQYTLPTGLETFNLLRENIHSIENGDYTFSEEVRKKAEDVRSYIIKTELDPEKRANDYYSNLRDLIGFGYMTHRQSGLLASAVNDYNKQKFIENKKSTLADKFFGEVGSRVPLKSLTVESVYHQTGAFGTSTKITLYDESKHMFVWKQTGYFEYEKGSILHLNGTIVSHTNWHSKKFDQTMFENTLSRCKILTLEEVDELINKIKKKEKKKKAIEPTDSPSI